VHLKFWSENLTRRGHSENLDVDWKVIVECTSILGKWGGKGCIGFIWLRVRTSGGLL
jgi:hypothetical protein